MKNREPSDDWPFADPKNLAVITTKSILSGVKPILYVVHDAEEVDWQFLDGDDTSLEDAAIVSLKSMTEIDSSLLLLADLPLGWEAWREDRNSPWSRKSSE